jgi:type IV pilus assembly protein PilM
MNVQKIVQLFKPKRPVVAGIDISNVSVKFLVLSQQMNGRYRVEDFCVFPLPSDAVVEKKIVDSEAVTQVLKQILDKTKSNVKAAAVAVPDSSVITKILQVDAELNDNEMEEHITMEADKYIPYPLEEVSLDFQRLHPNEKNPKLVDVLLVASRSENVNSQVNAIDDAGLDVDVVDVQSFAMERACRLLGKIFPNSGHDETIAVIDVGASMTNLTVLHDMKTIFTRSEVFGGEQLTRDIQRHYCLSYSEAGLAKKQATLPDDYVTEVLEPFKETAVLQVRRSLQFFFSGSQHSKISHILLAGGTSTMPGFAQMIEDKIGIPTTVANPLMDMMIAKKVDVEALTKDAPALMVCCGLALRSFQHDDD